MLESTQPTSSETETLSQVVELTELECLQLENTTLKKQLLEEQLKSAILQQSQVKNEISMRLQAEDQKLEVDLSKRIARIVRPDEDNSRESYIEVAQLMESECFKLENSTLKRQLFEEKIKVATLEQRFIEEKLRNRLQAEGPMNIDLNAKVALIVRKDNGTQNGN